MILEKARPGWRNFRPAHELELVATIEALPLARNPYNVPGAAFRTFNGGHSGETFEKGLQAI